ncbi:MAG TPA: MurR/RpiR family transcriptional regulator [Enterococcus sp.]|nr:MurR/RpiR family transcriptional regulator [Enterococcus sp.]HPR80675.1 MurR/RpiR family transcriptional regulator [Enterococcus sp.]
MKLQRLIHHYVKDLSELDLEILHYIVEHTDEVVSLSILDLAERVHSSKSSILRLTKKMGFSGYSEFKYFLRQEQQHLIVEESEKQIYDKQLDDIQQTLDYIRSVDLQPINELLSKSKTIYCYSTGFSQKKPLEEFSKMMLSLEKRVIILPNKTELDMAMPMITSDDCFMVTSVSGETADVKENLTTFHMRQIPVIAITASGNNYFARNSTHHLNYYCSPFTIGKKHSEVISLITLHCLIDYLYRSYGIYQLTEG